MSCGVMVIVKLMMMVVVRLPDVTIGLPLPAGVDDKTQPVQAVILLRFQTATVKPGQLQRAYRVKQAVPLFRKGVQQGGYEHVSCDASHRV